MHLDSEEKTEVAPFDKIYQKPKIFLSTFLLLSLTKIHDLNSPTRFSQLSLRQHDKNQNSNFTTH